MGDVIQIAVDDVGVPEFERILACLSDGVTAADERVQGYVFLLELLKLVDGKALNEKISQDTSLLCCSIRRDLGSSRQDLCSIALKTLGFLLQRKHFVTHLPDDEASKTLLTLFALITTSKKIICNLGFWCLAVQEFKFSALLQHVKMIVSVIVHGIDNPMDSLDITYESLKAVRQLVKQLPEQMRDLSWIWAPPLYKKLLHKNSKMVELVANCLSEMQSVLLPPQPRLSEVVLLHIHQQLLSKMEKMIKLDGHSACIAVQAWGWLVRLLGLKTVSEKSLVKVMLKLLEDPFVSASPQVRIGSQVAWISIIDAFVPCEGDTQSSEVISTPSKALQFSHKRLRLLLVPLLNTMSWEKDKMVQRNCWCIWIHLLNRLGQWVNERFIFDAAVMPMLEIVFKFDPRDRDGSVWQGCIDILTDIVSCKRLEEKSPDITIASTKISQSPKTPVGITCIGVFSESHHKNIGWSPWPLDRLESLIRIVHLLWTCPSEHQPGKSHLQDTSSNSSRDHRQTAQECWRLLVRGVQADGWNTLRPSDNQIAAMHLLLNHLNTVCADKLPTSLLPSAWALVEIFMDVWGPNALNSSFYKIHLQLAEPFDFLEDTDGDCVSMNESPVQNMVTPIVYISSAWFKLTFQTAATDGHMENVCLLQAAEKLISTVQVGFDLLGSYSGFTLILDQLASRSDLYQEQSPSHKKAMESGTGFGQNWCFLLAVWRTVANSLREQVEKVNDVPPIRGGEQDSGYSVIARILLFPLKYFLLGFRKCEESNTEFDQFWKRKFGRLQELENFTSELESVNGPYFKLFDCVSRVSAMKCQKPNFFVSGFFNKVAKVMNSFPNYYTHWLEGKVQGTDLDAIKLSDAWNGFVGNVVAHALETAEVSNPAMLAISRKRRKAGYGASSVRVHYMTTSVELDDVNNLRNLLDVASRLLIIWHEKLTKEGSSITLYESVVRAFRALTNLMQHATSQNDSVLILQVLAPSMTCWLTATSQATGSDTDENHQTRHFSPTLLEGLDMTWTALLSSLQNCRPQLTFDTNLLLAQAPSLASAFLHSHAAISNQTLAFWQKTYGSKAVKLNYPLQLVDVFAKLRQKVNVTLPDWTATSVPITTERQVLDVPEGSSRPPHIKVAKQLGDRVQSMMNAVDKRAAKRQDHRQPGSATRQMNFGVVAQESWRPMHQQTSHTNKSQPAEKQIEDHADLQSLVNYTSDTNMSGKQGVFLPTPEANALIDSLVNMDSIPRSSPDENSKSSSSEQTAISSDLHLQTDRRASTATTGDDDDNQPVATLSQTGPVDASKVDPPCHYGELQFLEHGRDAKNQGSKKVIEGTPNLVTPPMAFDYGPSSPPKLPAEGPQALRKGESVQAAVVKDGGRNKGRPLGSERPPRRKKLKFQDDGQQVTSRLTRKKAGPLTTRQREGRPSQPTDGHVVKTYSAADFSNSPEGDDYDVMNSVTLPETPAYSYCPLLERSRCAPVTRASVSQGAAAHSSAEDSASRIVRDESQMVPLEKVDYPKLKDRLKIVLAENLMLTYQQIARQERYECLPRLIQNRLRGLATIFRKTLLNSTVTNTAHSASAEKWEPLEERPLQESAVACPSSPGQSVEIEVKRVSSSSKGHSHEHNVPFSSSGRRERRTPKSHRYRLRSSGKLRGGKHWRIESELERVLTARLEIKKISTKRQRSCRNLAESKTEEAVILPGKEVTKEMEDEEQPAVADSLPQAADFCPEVSWEGTPVQEEIGGHDLDNGVPLALPTLVQNESSSLDMQNPRTTTAPEAMMTMRTACPTTETRQAASEFHHANAETGPTSSFTDMQEENSPFQVRKLNRGLLRGSYAVPTRALPPILAGDEDCVQHSTRATHHNPRKRRTPKRTPSQDPCSSSSVSSDAALHISSPNSTAEVSIRDGAQSSEGVSRGRRRSMSVSAEPPLPLRESGYDQCEKGCSRSTEMSLPHHQNRPTTCATGEEIPGEEIQREKCLPEDVQETPDSVNAAAMDQNERDCLANGAPQSVNARDRMERDTIDSSPEFPVGKLRILLDKDDEVQVCHVLTAVLASSKWRDMTLAEASRAQLILRQLQEELVLGHNHIIQS